MTWPQVKIGDLGSIVSGATPRTAVSDYWDGDILWVTPKDLSNLQGTFISETANTITQKGLASCSATILPPDSVLFSSRAPIGLLAINTVPMCTNQGFKSIVPNKDKVNSQYLYYLLKSKKRYLNSIGNGATFKELSKDVFSKVTIPLPPLEDQVRIATVLTRAEQLIAKRKESITALDALLKSTFLEIFGDPVRNEKGWEKKTCEEVVEILTGFAFKSKDYSEDATQVKLCGGLIIMPDSIEWDKCNYWPKSKLAGLDRYQLNTHDIVIAMDRPWISSGFKIGMIKSSELPALLVQRTARLRGKGMNQFFLYHLFKDRAFTIHCKPTETTVPHISIKDFNTFMVIAPPLSLQNQFAAIVVKVEALKAKYQQSLTELENLYGSLSQRAFKGELDLSGVRV